MQDAGGMGEWEDRRIGEWKRGRRGDKRGESLTGRMLELKLFQMLH
jgi:hypothetical protein